LGDVFSGVVLSFSRPYRPGDWINLKGGTRILKGEAKDDATAPDVANKPWAGRS
jgi:small-conductance mechanosensitive channel